MFDSSSASSSGDENRKNNLDEDDDQSSELDLEKLLFGQNEEDTIAGAPKVPKQDSTNNNTNNLTIEGESNSRKVSINLEVLFLVTF